MKINLKYTQKDLIFEAENEAGASIFIGQTNNVKVSNVIRPMETLVMSLASCSSIDIIKILKKQKQHITEYRVEVDAKREEEKIPSLFETITLKFIFKGEISPSKIQRAVSLSLGKYCSVSKIIEQTAHIKFELELNGKAI
jgi:putative redox protein